MFKNHCNAMGVRPRKFGLDMDVRWNSTYLMLKHLIPVGAGPMGYPTRKGEELV